jgi:hypothetical protein
MTMQFFFLRILEFLSQVFDISTVFIYEVGHNIDSTMDGSWVLDSGTKVSITAPPVASCVALGS